MLGDETGIHSEPCTEVHPLPRETEARTEEARLENSTEASTETCTAARSNPCSEAGATAGACPGTRTVEGIPELPRRLERLGTPHSKQ